MSPISSDEENGYSDSSDDDIESVSDGSSDVLSVAQSQASLGKPTTSFQLSGLPASRSNSSHIDPQHDPACDGAPSLTPDTESQQGK